MYMYIHIYIHTYTYVYIYIYIHIYIYTYGANAAAGNLFDLSPAPRSLLRGRMEARGIYVCVYLCACVCI